MSRAWWVTGDTLSTLRALPDGCVDLVMCSPPFLALRSYLPADDPAKAAEIGQESTPGAFLDVLLDVTEECARVLAPHGSLVVELGDTYSGSGGAGGDYAGEGLRDGQPKFEGSAIRNRRYAQRGRALEGWPLDKSLCLIPESYRFALAYGTNPHTGRETPPWRIRNVIRWCRPNPSPGALGDKFRPATSDLVVACKSGARWFDLDAVRTAAPRTDNKRSTSTQYEAPGQPERKTRAADENGERIYSNEAGAPPLDWWDDVFDEDLWQIPTVPYKGAHYATYPPALVVRPVKAMCPLEVCTQCGEPRRRITKPSDEYVAKRSGVDFLGKSNDRDTGLQGERLNGRPNAEYVTLGWTDCGHDAYRPGRVLDPFAGSGTTLAVASGHGRDSIGIDLDARNAHLARERVGMWLTETTAADLAGELNPAARFVHPDA